MNNNHYLIKFQVHVPCNLKVSRMSRQRSLRVSKPFSEKEMARIQNRESNHEAAAMLRKGLLDLGIGGESLSVDVGVDD